MRLRGLVGPNFGNHAGCKVPIKSVGNFYSPGVVLGEPAWYPVPDQNVSQGLTWDVDVNDYVYGDTPRTYTIASGALPIGITLNTNGTFSGTVTDLSGSGSVTFTSTNSKGATDSDTVAWTIP